MKKIIIICILFVLNFVFGALRKTTNKEAEAALTIGINACKNKDFDSAIINFTKAIELDPKYAAAYNGRGGAYGSLKKYPEAIADCTKAIKLDPTDAIAYNNRGIAYKALGKTIEAEADFAKAKSLKN